jgi:2-polyprenyl-3-methyl-5-hydroxy-6-metoxy-1,4-benzoquinol methylase
MLKFSHHGKLLSLKLGEAWTPPVEIPTYHDAPAKEMQEVVRSVCAGQPWRKVVASHYAKKNPWLHETVTSTKRDLFFRQHPPKVGAKVLDIGSGWGQIALPLARDSRAQVVALEPTPERLAFIKAAAAQEHVENSMYFLQADFFDVNFASHFDLITCVGVLEWVPKFRTGSPRTVQIDFLRLARKALAPGGKLVIGIENRFGLKYLLGAPDDHINAANICVFDEKLAQEKWLKQANQPLRSFTFTRAELEKILREAGFKNLDFYSAFPDYKIPEKILPFGKKTNEYLSKGVFTPEHNGVTGQPLAIQAELKSHYRSLAQLGIASDFAPSFFVSAST